jgi:hypothetical protein
MKIAVGILDFLSPPPRNNSGTAQQKRSREETSPTPSRSLDRDHGDRGGRDRERHPQERREDQRSRSAYNNYPSGFRGGRGRGGGGGHRRFFWAALRRRSTVLSGSLIIDLKMLQWNIIKPDV